MKKITLLVASIFLVGSVANASSVINYYNESRFPVNIYEAEPIVFVERGIEFFVFPDGQFDFNTRPSTRDFYYKNGRRTTFNKTYGARNNKATNYGIKIEHDYFGRVRRVGNVFINYDANDRIKRIGSVYMAYNRFALEQVGGLKIVYNRKGQIINLVGLVKNDHFNTGFSYSSCDYDDYNSAADGNENDYYYYKSNGKKAKIEGTTLKEDKKGRD